MTLLNLVNYKMTDITIVANIGETIIYLTRGFIAVIDDEDKDLAELKWRAHVDKECNSAYVVREIRDKTKESGRSTMRLH